MPYALKNGSLYFALALLVGCTSDYVTPGGPAKMSAFTDHQLAAKWNVRPAARFPAHIAAVRVQQSGYYGYRTPSYGAGKYSVVTVRDVEGDDAIERITKLNGIAGLGMINRLLLAPRLDSDLELRDAAASLQADMLLIYTFDTQFETDHVVPHAGLITLGVFPDRRARVDATASALLMDTRTGFIYAALEATAHEKQPANFWTNEQAIDDARRRAERNAFDQLVEEFAKAWPNVVARHAKGGAPQPATVWRSGEVDQPRSRGDAAPGKTYNTP